MRKPELKLIAGLLALFALASTACASQYRWTGVERVVAISDPHGAYDAMLRTLANAGVVDASGDWSGGDSHLVITGDLLDRGADSRRIMDLVMQLELQAQESGGRVHLTLGNHEVMNLVGDLRYVSSAEYAAFAGEESREDRARWFGIYLDRQRAQSATELDEALLRDQFDRERPPGFYAHRAAFSTTGRYGSWLMQKPLLVVVNDTAYVHGGLPPIVAELGLERLNEELLAQVTDYVAALEALYASGSIDPAVNFYEHARHAETLASDANTAPGLQPALNTVASLNDAIVHDSSGPLWYRGDVGCSVLVEGDIIADALEILGARRVVIGHTPTVTRQVLSRFGGRVIEIDTGMLKSSYRGSGHAVILEGDELSVVGEDDRGKSLPVPHPRRVGARADDVDVGMLQDILANGELIGTSTDAAGRSIVQVGKDGRQASALFSPGQRKSDFDPELAAFRLDLLLELDLVPVTVPREIDGRRGTLQFLPENFRDESYRAEAGQGGGAWCPLQRQWNTMYVFDVLIGNDGRTPANMGYSPDNWQLLSVQHADAFGTRAARPRYLADMPLSMTSTWIGALNALSDTRLEAELGDVLDKRRRAALGKRRDLLLELAREARAAP